MTSSSLVIMEFICHDHTYAIQSWGNYGVVLPEIVITNGSSQIASLGAYRVILAGGVVINDPYALASLIGPDTGPLARALADLQREFEFVADMLRYRDRQGSSTS